MDAIKLLNVSKKYTLIQGFSSLIKTLLFQKRQKILALNKITFSVKKGETVGIIGENGSGKSTLLKVIAGITKQDKGEILVDGRVGSLIELGAGFHPDMTGEENIYSNAALLGYTKEEIGERYNQIVDFADIGNYIRQPVKTYSSGMVVRLGFAVAIHLNPDVLLIDEVFSVGDEHFQRKSIAKISEFQKKDKTLVLVSHNLFLVKELCKKVYLLNKGRIVKSGEAVDVINHYLHHYVLDEKATFRKRGKSKKILIKKIEFIGDTKRKKLKFKINEPLDIIVTYENREGNLPSSFGISITDKNGLNLYGFSTDPIQTSKGKGRVKFYISSLPPIEGKLYFSFGIADMVRTIRYDSIENQEIEVKGEPTFYKGIVNFNCRYEHKRL
ncbi:hypothetical protein A2129_01425 [Candidatus Woesebacteria bacterium GWC1_42_13]|uniref:ABC transporter domain-containing protein n=1 Tax=Candidatus Woesebacteria bacterium GWC1_42_13 TaxID=1802475 RepID=A0A1F7WV60_9BACT|nr:MAG: hypothetical protein A2129_01425 [Candidatus Woesebacteria bacterium GWC1_42_13]